MMLHLRTIDELITLVTALLEAEDDAKWGIGDALVIAIDNGLHYQCGGIRALETLIATSTGRGWRTMHRRRVAASTFAPEDRNPRLAWETHCRIAELAATNEAIDPLAWLNVAADQEMTAEQVEAAIKAVNGDASRGERVYVVRAAAASLVAVDGCRVTLDLDRLVDIPAGAEVIITMAYDDVQVPAHEGG